MYYTPIYPKFGDFLLYLLTHRLTSSLIAELDSADIGDLERISGVAIIKKKITMGMKTNPLKQVSKQTI